MTFEKVDIIAVLHILPDAIPFIETLGKTAHWHYDCMYIFNPKSDRINLNKKEVSDYKWVSLDYQFDDKGLSLAVAKIKDCLPLANPARGMLSGKMGRWRNRNL